LNITAESSGQLKDDDTSFEVQRKTITICGI
jgi:hypothetical protein